jgi:hypothetical protein
MDNTHDERYLTMGNTWGWATLDDGKHLTMDNTDDGQHSRWATLDDGQSLTMWATLDDGQNSQWATLDYGQLLITMGNT